jgi:hypothetical protein
MSIVVAVFGLIALALAMVVWSRSRASTSRHRGEHPIHDGAVYAGFDGGYTGTGDCDSGAGGGDAGGCDGGGGDGGGGGGGD